MGSPFKYSGIAIRLSVDFPVQRGMESGFTDGDCYEKKFNPRIYLETYYLSPLGEVLEKTFMPFVLTNLVKTFSSDTELVSFREKWTEKEKKLRDSIKQVLKCDVHQTNPLDPVELEPVDCLMTSLCLEAACKDKAAYCAALRNVTSLLKPDGVLILISDLNESYYIVDELKFSSLKFDQAFLESAIKEAGYEIDGFEICVASDHIKSLVDCEATIFLVAHKCKNA
ncbi:hypothetical protein scyTo_0020236 [Scyliorhinus torazame]|uniref:Uncharacterized protein n=1 Tax=Scyliorhinus torazame TaxID=75743 RepID=A0A401Q2S9_SCYTO|nr:hypothetical protein [Scyliorhinus torazame]